MSNIILDKSYTKCGAETSPRPFSRKSRLSISLNQQSRHLYNLYVQVDDYQTILIPRCWPFTFTSYIYIKFFQKTKSGLELVSLPYFLHNVWRKIFIMLYSMNWPNFIAWLPLFLKISGNMYIAIFYFPVCDVINFENNFSFLTKPLPYMTKKVKAKI